MSQGTDLRAREGAPGTPVFAAKMSRLCRRRVPLGARQKRIARSLSGCRNCSGHKVPSGPVRCRLSRAGAVWRVQEEERCASGSRRGAEWRRGPARERREPPRPSSVLAAREVSSVRLWKRRVSSVRIGARGGRGFRRFCQFIPPPPVFEHKGELKESHERVSVSHLVSIRRSIENPRYSTLTKPHPWLHFELTKPPYGPSTPLRKVQKSN